MQLTYNRRNLVGDGCLEPGNAGLSTFGRALVERLNERKLLIDLSHGGERTTQEAIAASKVPLAISHTGCAALVPLPRNKTDAELRALADKGGVAGIYLMPFLRSEGQPTAEDLLRHIEHAVKVCGEDHVGIGTDGGISPIKFDAEYRKKFAAEVAERRAHGISAPGERPDVYTFLPDLNSADRFARIGALLAQRGHSAARIEKILGGNFARLFDTVWRVRARACDACDRAARCTSRQSHGARRAGDASRAGRPAFYFTQQQILVRLMQQERRDILGGQFLPRQHFFNRRRQLARSLQDHRQAVHAQRCRPIERQSVAILPVAMQHRVQNFPASRAHTHQRRAGAVAEEHRRIGIERTRFNHRRHLLRADHQHIPEMPRHLSGHHHPNKEPALAMGTSSAGLIG